jgi:protein arginine kinase
MVSIMVNEEDHLRLQSLQSGLQILEAWRLIDKIDTELEKKLEYAFSREWGYLTACPTNTGTGMRASVMVHLAALIMSKRINRVMKSVSQLGFTVRGLYGEGTEVVGGFFQISNSLTLGYSEEILINNLERVIIQVVEQEQKARANLLNKKQAQIEDMIWRAYGILKNARLISSRETLELLSALRLGIHLGIVKDISLKTLNELLIFTQPAHLQKITGGEQKPGERDFKRAEFIRHILRKK